MARHAHGRRRMQMQQMGSIRYADYAASLLPLLWYKFNEPSGTTVTNYGSLGSGDGTFTPGVGAVAQTDSMGAQEAYDFDGADSKVTGPTSTSINNAPIFSVAAKLKADTSGEATNGYIWSDNGGNRVLLISSGASSPYRLSFGVWCTTMQALAVSAVGSGVIQSDDMWVFGTYDNTGDRTPHIYFGNAAAVAEATYSTSTPASNTLANASGALLLGNNSSNIRTWDGLFGEFMFFDRVLTLAEMRALTGLSAA